MSAYLLNLIFCVFVMITNGSDVEIYRYEVENPPDKIWDLTTMRWRRLRNGVYALNGDILLRQDLDYKSMLSVKAYFSESGGNAYKLLPFHIGPKLFCDFMNNEYKKFTRVDAKSSDSQEITEKSLCPLKKGPYSIRNLTWELPVPLAKHVFYKIQVIMTADTGDETIYNTYLKVTH